MHAWTVKESHAKSLLLDVSVESRGLSDDGQYRTRHAHAYHIRKSDSSVIFMLILLSSL